MRNPAVVIYVDLQKVFDTVPFERLQFKVEQAGIREPILKWTEGFVEERNTMF